MNGLVRIATRRSMLALWQAEHVATILRRRHPDLEVELVPISTKGDRIQDRSLAAIGGKGLFVKELETALLENRADAAVHSMKDVPGDLPPELTIAAVLPRADARDVLVAPRARALEELPPAARVGTSSLRRQAQLLALRPDLQIRPLRGNVDTRLRKLDEGELDAIVLAGAGLERLGLTARISGWLDMAVSLPAVGQGVIGIECRRLDAHTLARVEVLEDAATRVALEAERAFAARLQGSCQSPIAAHARLEAGRLDLVGLVAEPDGSRLYREQASDAPAAAVALGARLAERLLGAGAAELLERLRAPG